MMVLRYKYVTNVANVQHLHGLERLSQRAIQQQQLVLQQ